MSIVGEKGGLFPILKEWVQSNRAVSAYEHFRSLLDGSISTLFFSQF